MSHEYHRGMFLFRGNAVGTGSTFFETQAQSLLPTIGGISRGLSEEPPRNPYKLSYKKLSTHSTGGFNPETQSYETHVHAEVGEYRIGDQFHVGELAMGLSSIHSGRKVTFPIKMELPNPFRFKLAGHEAEVTFDKRLLEMETKEDFVEAFRNERFYKAYESKFYRSKTQRHSRWWCLQPNTPMANGYLVYSPVKHIKWDGPGRVDGHVITVEGFGRVYVAETYRKDNAVRSNLLRLELGDPQKTTISGAYQQPQLFMSNLKQASDKQESVQTSPQKRDQVVLFAVEINGDVVPP